MKPILTILLGLVVFAALSFLKTVAVNIDFIEGHNWIKNSVTVIFVALMFLLVIIGNKKLNRISYSNSYLSFDKFIYKFVLGSGFCLVLIVGTISVMALLHSPLPVLTDDPELFINLTLTTLLISIYEESIFRGFISQTIFISIPNVLITSIIGSVTFLLFHLNTVTQGDLPILNLINILTAGILLNYLYYIYKSIWVPIGYHFVHNLFLKIIINEDELIDYHPEWIFTIGLIIMTGIFVIRFHSKKMTVS
jgi:membrane protease YdiL (CAAX protease family)